MKKEKFFLLIIVLAMVDQLTKLFVILYKGYLPIEIINNVFEIVYCENKGIAFGLGNGLTQVITFLTGIILMLIMYAIYKNYTKINGKLLFGAALLLSGGIGNLLDRIFRLHVVDFIYFKAIDFPVFNFADICVVCGVIVICYGIWFIDRGEKVEKNNS